MTTVVEHVSTVWTRLGCLLTGNLGRFAGGSAVSDPSGLLAVERETLEAKEGTPDEQLADRRLCPAVGLPFGRAGQPGRLGGLALFPPVRRAGRLRPHP
jgi:hypothetical protein